MNIYFNPPSNKCFQTPWTYLLYKQWTFSIFQTLRAENKYRAGTLIGRSVVYGQLMQLYPMVMILSDNVLFLIFCRWLPQTGQALSLVLWSGQVRYFISTWMNLDFRANARTRGALT